jgi:hypothetical protein
MEKLITKFTAKMRPERRSYRDEVEETKNGQKAPEICRNITIRGESTFGGKKTARA